MAFSGYHVDHIVNNSIWQRGYMVSIDGSSAGTYPSYHTHVGVEIILVHNHPVEIATHEWSYQMESGAGIVLLAKHAHGTRPLAERYARTVVGVRQDIVSQYPIVSDLTEQPDQAVYLSPKCMYRCLWAAQQLASMDSVPSVPVAELRGLVGLILSEIEAAKVTTPTATQNPVALFNSVVVFMKSQMDEIYPLGELARQFYLSERQLHRLFQRYVGCSPQRYWLQIRLQYAKQLLSAGVPIKSVAEQVGFETVTGFERAFRRLYGITPTQCSLLSNKTNSIM